MKTFLPEGLSGSLEAMVFLSRPECRFPTALSPSMALSYSAPVRTSARLVAYGNFETDTMVLRFPDFKREGSSFRALSYGSKRKPRGRRLFRFAI